MRKYIITEKRHIKQMNRNERAYLDNVVRPIIKKDCDDSLPKLTSILYKGLNKNFLYN